MTYSKKPVFRSAFDFDNRPLAQCLETIAEQKRLLRIVAAVLPTSIAEHMTHCVLSGNRLLIYTDSAAWASQIRFFQEAMLNKLHDLGQQKITHVRIKVMLPQEDVRPMRKARLPSPEIVHEIAGLVDEKSDDELDKALARLANILKKRIGS